MIKIAQGGKPSDYVSDNKCEVKDFCIFFKYIGSDLMKCINCGHQISARQVKSVSLEELLSTRTEK